MFNFDVLQKVTDDEVANPFTTKDIDGVWHEGTISVTFLQNNFGQYATATEMKKATQSEGLKLFFDYLVEQGKIPA